MMSENYSQKIKEMRGWFFGIIKLFMNLTKVGKQEWY